ncbi:MAG: carbohydrate binding family 9 domain-containing protein [Chitinophagaceae bacterium]|nr:carbohydrate binding family 9 domain-containing protein [Chitinophagaceae bacterium]
MQNRFQQLSFFITACKKACLLLSLLFSCYFIKAQNISEFQKGFQLNIQPTTDKIKIDGILDEPVWATTEVAKNFIKKFPNDIGAPKRQTEVRFTYDNNNIYFGFKVYDSGAAISRSLKRDIGNEGNDVIGIMMDPLNKKTNGFYFLLSALNVQSEDQLNLSFQDKPSWSWDTKWFSATKDYGTYWIAEIMIPLKSIRYDPKQLHWGINFLRGDAKNNEYSNFTRVPPIFKSFDLGYMGLLNWPTTTPSSKDNIILLPFISGASTEDQENGKPLNSNATGGFDAKVALNASLNLDLTVNPDFSQVEVDQQVTNLTRFNIFLPERRGFFLENSDLFSNFGMPFVRPFYSRTIGLDKDGNKIPILFGARMSGNLNPATRIGLMNMQTGKQGNYAGENFTAFTLQRSVLKRSIIKTYFLNRENFISAEEAKKNPLDKYGRNLGVTFEYSNTTGTFSSWTDIHKSFKANINDDDIYATTGFMANSKHWSYITLLGSLGKNYYTDMGFVQGIDNYDAIRDTAIRIGFKNLFNSLSYRIFPENGPIGKMVLKIESFATIHPDNSINQADNKLGPDFQFKNTSIFSLDFKNTIVNLKYPISFTDGVPLPVGNYVFNQIQIKYISDMRKILGIESMLNIGQFYNGQVKGISMGISYRNQPHFNLLLSAQFNNIVFPNPYGSTNLVLLQPRVEWNFSTKLFWSTFVQYNTQSNNFNINSRLQYRFKPMSDFFLVYTDNYFTDPLFKNKNRALIFKFSYWFNL